MTKARWGRRVASGFTLAVAGLLAGGLVPISSQAGAASSAAPIKIGYICTCTGPLASSAQIAPVAYKAWVSSVNASGGINGHKIQLIEKDDAGNPGTALSDAQELVEQDHVIAIAEISNADNAFQNYVDQQHIPVIGSNISSLLMFSDPNFFPEGQTNDSLINSVVLAAKKVGAKNFGTFYCAESAICQQLAPYAKAIGQQYGVPMVYSSAISASAPNYTAPCLAAQQAGAKALFIGDAVQVVQSVAQSCSKQGYKPVIIADDGAVAKTFTSTPGLSDGLMSMQPDIPFFVTSNAGIKAMTSAFKKYQPQIFKDPNYNEEVVESWVSGLLFTAAAKAGGLGANGADPTSQQLYDGLYKLNNETLGGMAPPLTFTQGKPNSVKCWFWMRTKNGKFTTPYGLKPACVPGT